MQEIDDLIEQNTGLMVSVLKHYNLLHNPDAESLAYEALWRACADYDETLGYKRSTLIVVYVKRALGNYLRTRNKVRQLLVVSYNNIAYCDDGVNHEFLELFPCEQTTEEIVVKDTLHNITREVFNDEVSMLTGKKKAIVDIWGQSDFEATNNEIAKQVGVSQPYVNQVIAAFKQRMCLKLKEDFYD